MNHTHNNQGVTIMITQPIKQILSVVSVLALLLFCGAALAENIDPDNDGSQYAWSENVGWINLQPRGDGGPGVEVEDTVLTGYMWGENIGWINMAPTEGGVLNDGAGNLSGYAWGENVGWIKFAPTYGGVFIDPATGEFRGYAWGENIGWINFDPNGFSAKTSWRGDTDGDGVLDSNDNCPENPNPDQEDSDLDGFGNACDECFNDPDKTDPGICDCGFADTDSDGDGTLDCNDGCPDDPAKTEPGICGCGFADTDSDGDGIPDGWESNNSQDPLYDDAGLDPDQDGLTNLQEWQYRTDPNNPDTDGDGASDGWEITYLLHPKGDYDGVMDYDGDGHMNWQEFISGTDPTNVLSVFSINTIATPAASNLVLSWPSVSNRLYSLSFRTNLATGEWSLVFSNTLATPPTNTVTVDVESAVQRFYRIGVEQAE